MCLYVNLKYVVENLCCGRHYINLCFVAILIGISIQECSNPKKEAITDIMVEVALEVRMHPLAIELVGKS